MSTIADPAPSTIVDVSTLGERLRQEREAAGLNQPELAREAGVTKQAISQIENGSTRKPEAATLDPIAKRLNLRTTWLLNGTGPKHPAESDPSQHLGYSLEKIGDAIRLLRHLQQITKDPAHTGENERSLFIAYQVIDSDSRETVRAEVVDLVERLATKLREDQGKADVDKRREVKGTSGEDGRSNARRSGKA
jgi:transcriptional regulator with XRE-family HTH domain